MTETSGLEKGNGAAALAARVRLVPKADPEALSAVAADLVALARAADRPGLAACLEGDAHAARLVVAACADAPFLRDLVRLDLPRLDRILFESPERIVEEAIAAAALRQPGEAETMAVLRRLKQEVALTIALADLGGVWNVGQVTDALSRFADAAVQSAVRFLMTDAAAQGKVARDHPERPAEEHGYVVLAMGKHGAFELNYSSDIDLIVMYDAERAGLADPDEAGTFFVRLTRRLVRILQDRTADGYVFRTDLRLRPDPGATPLAISLPAALQYYESMGQNWERAALIKARPCAGDIAAGTAFLAEIRPFIWRKSFDYASIADVHSIKRQINAVKGHGVIAVAGHNVKLGRGGIREIEFFVQTQQLIAGGREPRLRGRSTRAMLAMLAELGWIEPAARDELDAAYVFLRAVEHRIQMERDAQSHTLPEDEAGLARIAWMMGFGDPSHFAERLREHLEAVQRHYVRLFESAPDLGGEGGDLVFTGSDDDPATIEHLAAIGFRQPSEVARAIRAWHFGRYRAVRSSRARERLTELIPALLGAFARTDNADAAFHAFDRFLSQLPAGVQLFSLLCSHPALLDLIALIMGAAPRLAAVLTRRPRVLDALLDPAFFDTVPDEVDLGTRFARSINEARSYEERLDRARIFGQEQAFLIGVRVLTGTIAPEAAGEAYAALADVVVRGLLAAASDELARQHGHVPGGQIALVAMGKLGGREMTAASDLDLILLYDHDEGAEHSDGPRPLAPSQYYARLTQRLVAALSAPTGEGTLYEVDFRLRPSGNAGPLATHIRGFEAYQATEAWTWEQMALTRARPIAGHADLIARVNAAIHTAVGRPRADLAGDVLEMRRRIERDKGSSDPWDIKVAPGGLIDVEFLAQYLMLANAAARPDSVIQTTARALAHLAETGLLAPGDADILVPAIGLYQALTQVLRLAVEGPFKADSVPRGVLDLIARAAAAPSFAAAEALLVETEAAVRATFDRLIGPVREG
ncbi:bifunctional [glutamine synthetase] adenylyltransferase/[glutamine synthetase]-adenylyl-L-tyrosine phosphorylase [Segnochrobactrum spirostomi]|uniref:Bifunctional glutamine synthetase adenylyltransferase/adenylyl-removing enzyme n=1 Tax=Segnochrobactrum spirostomi TaxID=2608987 RepID=A0A6A7Y1N9_9HYPH|nr:bifunctional [glutamine synthetase] adenylyltransferase/[glutamine synthetase]-adenylyl-L-tyrosine phosphorylase [Segnochrobactrum spirostomi]MQT12298.1 bifunctional [glutamine synthetase] adenylyltransferase/[glutamine synthetase]-adenylyl-L-tyrosine phosphorylase [Segnochrobactrum spirostomi]